MNIQQWAKRWGVSEHALAELSGAVPDLPASPGAAEASVQENIRLAAPNFGCLLWRNNRGVAVAENRVVRFGLANDSAQVNQRVKSSDLIGIGPGGRFVSLEVKKGNWKCQGSPTEQAQHRWNNIIQTHGGIAGFITDPAQLKGYLRGSHV